MRRWTAGVALVPTLETRARTHVISISRRYALSRVAPGDFVVRPRLVGDAVIFDLEVHDREHLGMLTPWRVTVPRDTLRETMLDLVCERISLDVNVCSILVDRVEESLRV